MTVFELFQNTSEKEFKNFLMSKNIEYNQINDLLKIFTEIKNTSPTNPKETLEIIIFKGYGMEGYNNKQLFIEGIKRKNNLKKIPKDYQELEEHIERYSFSMTPWSECLNYTINDYCFKNFSPINIIITIICELTLFGDTQKEIQEKKDDLLQTLKEIEENYQKDKENENFSIFEDNRPKKLKDLQRKNIRKEIQENLKIYFEILNN